MERLGVSGKPFSLALSKSMAKVQISQILVALAKNSVKIFTTWRLSFEF